MYGKFFLNAEKDTGFRALSICFTQFRTENRCALFLELLQEPDLCGNEGGVVQQLTGVSLSGGTFCAVSVASVKSHIRFTKACGSPKG